MHPPEIEGASIVLLGAFNPSIFQPRWLGAQGLLRAEEAENAKISVVKNDIADFSTGWLHLQVLQDRLVMQTADPRQFLPLRDFAVGILNLLPHTPTHALGLNKLAHYKMESIEAWHAIGDALAPKQPWNGIMAGRPGLLSMVIEGRREDSPTAVLRVKVEPSPAAKLQFGVYIDINEEYRAPSGAVSGTAWAIEHIQAQWEAVLKYAESASSHILTWNSRQ
jgi:hypothetical protein